MFVCFCWVRLVGFAGSYYACVWCWILVLGVLLYYAVYCWVARWVGFWCLFVVGLLFLACLFVVVYIVLLLLFSGGLIYVYWHTFNSVDIYVFEFVVLI